MPYTDDPGQDYKYWKEHQDMDRDKLVPAAGIVGDDESATMIPMQQVQQDAGAPPNYGNRGMPEKKGIAPDPVTGQGDSRGERFTHREPNPFDMDSQPNYDDMLRKPVGEELGNDLSAGGGKRLNKGKNRLELIPPEWTWALGDILTKGSMKYEQRNWEKGMEWGAMIGCAKRHIEKFQAGERYDGKEFNVQAGTTGCHHLAMAAWNLLALMSYDLRGVGRNDLPKLDMGVLNNVNAETSDKGVDIDAT